MGIQKDPLGQVVTNTNNDGKINTYHVIGVVKDFHFRSMHARISPLVMVLGDGSGNMILKVKASDMSGLISRIKTQWALLNTETSFDFSFLDIRLNNTYKAEQKVGLILGIFAGLTIFVACLGLFGLAMFTTEQRNKEIGVRKVLGADVWQIVRLLSKDFVRLVIIAAVVAFPLSWWIMQKWIQDFAYRSTISWWIFIIAGCGTLLIALCTISYQAIKAAVANPVDSLRTE